MVISFGKQAINESMMVAAEKPLVKCIDIKSNATGSNQVRLNKYHSKKFNFDIEKDTVFVMKHSKEYMKSLFANANLVKCLFP